MKPSNCVIVLCRYDLNQSEAADMLELAVEKVLDKGFRTGMQLYAIVYLTHFSIIIILIDNTCLLFNR
jgi:hypothetical protein